MCLPDVPILSQLDPVYTPISHFLKIHLNIILLGLLSLRFPHLNPVYNSPLPHMHYMFSPSNSSQFYHLNNTGWGVQIIYSSLCSFLHSPFTSSLLGPNILLNTLFSNTLNQCSSLNVSGQVSHPYKKQAKL